MSDESETKPDTATIEISYRNLQLVCDTIYSAYWEQWFKRKKLTPGSEGYAKAEAREVQLAEVHNFLDHILAGHRPAREDA